MIWIIEVQYMSEYKIRLKFNDNTEKEVDLKDKILSDQRNIFKQLRNIEYFRQVKLNSEYDTITWPNGADIAPDTLYEMPSA